MNIKLPVLLLSILLVSCQPAYASYSRESSVCSDLRSIAKSASNMRQQGVDKEVVREVVVTPTTQKEEEATEIIYHVLDMVYQLPIYKTDVNKKLASETISNYVYLTCLSGE